jgi:hypothetical protein
MAIDKPAPSGGHLPGDRSSGLKDMGVLLGWILALVFIGGLFWFLTQPLRTKVIIRSVNRVLESFDESRRLDAAIPPRSLPGRTVQLGSWYTLSESGGRAVIFPMMSEGILAPFIAILSPGGTVDALLPLSLNAARILERLPQGTVRTYIRRIEGSGVSLSGGEERK